MTYICAQCGRSEGIRDTEAVIRGACSLCGGDMIFYSIVDRYRDENKIPELRTVNRNGGEVRIDMLECPRCGSIDTEDKHYFGVDCRNCGHHVDINKARYTKHVPCVLKTTTTIREVRR